MAKRFSAFNDTELLGLRHALIGPRVAHAALLDALYREVCAEIDTRPGLVLLKRRAAS